MSDNQATQVPLIELLRHVPSDYKAVWTDETALLAFHSVPVGRYCHEAADEITSLREDLERAKRETSQYFCRAMNCRLGAYECDQLQELREYYQGRAESAEAELAQARGRNKP